MQQPRPRPSTVFPRRRSRQPANSKWHRACVRHGVRSVGTDLAGRTRFAGQPVANLKNRGVRLRRNELSARSLAGVRSEVAIIVPRLASTFR